MPPSKAQSRPQFRQKSARPALRARLRAGRLADLDGLALADCTLFDTEDGTPGILVGAGIALPLRLVVEDPADQMVTVVRVIGRAGQQLAVTVESPATPANLPLPRTDP
ncbi:hypothetical protein GWI72_09640 [Microvirga tunisiensis]|uniref:PilZ domain-containing protein n=1 Tax=Pannonibacter tanglangensis TaxID=2750084 RepID=A0A7X5F312_9HYPH|nr:hypothetical protein [Pannonibacter sp. XCT-53]NBN78529.1 hypothetical protein [Pannonibacter sp. XCT-53]